MLFAEPDEEATSEVVVDSSRDRRLDDDYDAMDEMDLTPDEIREYVEKVEVEDLEESDDLDMASLPELPAHLAEAIEYDGTSKEDWEKTAAGLRYVDEFMGDWDGRDEDLDAPWRLEAEEIIRRAIAKDTSLALTVVDVFWDIGELKVTVDSQDGVDAEDTALASKAIKQALEPEELRLRVLERYDVTVSSPGADDVLSTQKQFDAFKGFDVEVDTINPINPENGRLLSGKLVRFCLLRVLL